MATKRKPRQTPPDPNSNRQRRRSFMRTAYQSRQQRRLCTPLEPPEVIAGAR